MLRGFISSKRYKTSGKNKAVKEYIVSFPGVDSIDKAKLLIGKQVEYRDGNLKIKGSIIATHGVRGKVRVRFRKGLPGELDPTKVFLQLNGDLIRTLRLETPSS
ncbi:MAG TPA: 50S ribosomal protein L35ae [Nitrososphaeria archaeon]|nr:50S ribosomal protein L35ae [Nitrososphaeria archaeon]